MTDTPETTPGKVLDAALFGMERRLGAKIDAAKNEILSETKSLIYSEVERAVAEAVPKAVAEAVPKAVAEAVPKAVKAELSTFKKEFIEMFNEQVLTLRDDINESFAARGIPPLKAVRRRG